jgi:hypothetical protein
MNTTDSIVAFPPGGSDSKRRSTQDAGEGGVRHPSQSPATAQPSQGLTLAAYAKAKHLPREFLQALGLSSSAWLSSSTSPRPSAVPGSPETTAT